MGERNRFHRRGGRHSGFTLMELLVVVVIIGILAAIALPKLFSAIQSAYAGVSYGRLGAFRDALQHYWIEHGGGGKKPTEWQTHSADWDRYPWRLEQLTACVYGNHNGVHKYIDNDGLGAGTLPPEEVGDGTQPGDQTTDWCTGDWPEDPLDHDWHKNRCVQGVCDGNLAGKGGWN